MTKEQNSLYIKIKNYENFFHETVFFFLIPALGNTKIIITSSQFTECVYHQVLHQMQQQIHKFFS